LAEYATKSIHNWPSFVCDVGFLADPNLSHNAVRAYFLKPNLDKSDKKYLFGIGAEPS
jgi:hypothetical protein